MKCWGVLMRATENMRTYGRYENTSLFALIPDIIESSEVAPLTVLQMLGEKFHTKKHILVRIFHLILEVEGYLLTSYEAWSQARDMHVGM